MDWICMSISNDRLFAGLFMMFAWGVAYLVSQDHIPTWLRCFIAVFGGAILQIVLVERLARNRGI